MDPISLLAAGGLALFGISLGAAAHRIKGPTRYRKILSWNDGWIANELLTPDLLAVVGDSLNVPTLAHRTAELESGFRRFILITKKGAPPPFAVLCVYDRLALSVKFAQAFSVGMTQPSKPEQWQHMHELTQFLQRDIAGIVVDAARHIVDPAARYQYLKAAVRRPALSAIITQDEGFADCVVKTATEVRPDLVDLVRKNPPQAVIGHDLGISSPSPIPHAAPQPLLQMDGEARSRRMSPGAHPTMELEDHGSPDDDLAGRPHEGRGRARVRGGRAGTHGGDPPSNPTMEFGREEEFRLFLPRI